MFYRKYLPEKEQVWVEQLVSHQALTPRWSAPVAVVDHIWYNDSTLRGCCSRSRKPTWCFDQAVNLLLGEISLNYRWYQTVELFTAIDIDLTQFIAYTHVYKL